LDHCQKGADVNPSFIQLHKIRAELKRLLSRKALKGVWTFTFGNGIFEVGIPKSDSFPKGHTWRGHAPNATVAQYNAYQTLLNKLKGKK
jgi:hypothetical protein